MTDTTQDDFHPATAGDDPIWLGGVEYITKSRSDDLVRAAVAAALVRAADTVEDWGRLLSGTEDVSEEVTGDILALITPDAQAALDRVVAVERERCAKVAQHCADFANTNGDYLLICNVVAAIRDGGK